MTHYVGGDQSTRTSYGKFDQTDIGTTGLSKSPLEVDGICTRLKRDGNLIDNYLYDLLTLATPHEEEKRLFKTMRKFLKVPFQIDEFGNVFVLVGTNKSPPVMFSCHLDTTHAQPFDLRLFYTDNLDQPYRDFIFAGRKHTNEKSKKEQVPTNLGADDKVGVWIMSNMINQGIPGIYMFHVGEERGCIGSKKVLPTLRVNPLLKNVKKAIAFDRGNYGDVVNVQHGRACCSTAFSTALASQLNAALRIVLKKPDGMLDKYFAPHAGVFTDTGTYMDVIEECSNLSVSYFSQHTPKEHFDPVWLNQALMPSILKIDWEALPVSRDPKAYQTQSYQRQNHNHNSNQGGYGYGFDFKMCSNPKDLFKPEAVLRDTPAQWVPDLASHPIDYKVVPDLEAFKRILEVANRRYTHWTWDTQLANFAHQALTYMHRYRRHANEMAEYILKMEKETGVKSGLDCLEWYQPEVETYSDEEDEEDTADIILGLRHYGLDGDKFGPKALREDIKFYEESRTLLHREIKHIMANRQKFPLQDFEINTAEQLMLRGGDWMEKLDKAVDALTVELVSQKASSLTTEVYEISQLFKCINTNICCIETMLYDKMDGSHRTILNTMMAEEDTAEEAAEGAGEPEEEERHKEDTPFVPLAATTDAPQTLMGLEAAIRVEVNSLPVGFRGVIEKVFAHHNRYCDILVKLATETSPLKKKALVKLAKEAKEKGTTLLHTAVIDVHSSSIPRTVVFKCQQWASRAQFVFDAPDHRLLDENRKDNVICLH